MEGGVEIFFKKSPFFEKCQKFFKKSTFLIQKTKELCPAERSGSEELEKPEFPRTLSF